MKRENQSNIVQDRSRSGSTTTVLTIDSLQWCMTIRRLKRQTPSSYQSKVQTSARKSFERSMLLQKEWTEIAIAVLVRATANRSDWNIFFIFCPQVPPQRFKQLRDWRCQWVYILSSFKILCRNFLIIEYIIVLIISP